MKMVNYFSKYSLVALLAAGIIATSCDSEDDTVAPPAAENEVEIITDVKLVFTDTANDVVVEARAKDQDGPGAGDLEILDTIKLSVSKTYILTYEIFNNLETPGEDIGEEIATEDDEHQLFFSFTEGAFQNPSGNGNVDNAKDPIAYNDEDDNGNPIGLSTTWVTSANTLDNGNFTVTLKHQPGVKTADSGSQDGDTDFNLSFVLDIE